MKTNRLIIAAMLGLVLSITPAMAQRGGGGRSGGGSSHSSSSHSSSSYSGGSRSSGSSFSGASRSSSSSYSGSSRSSYSGGSTSRSSSSFGSGSSRSASWSAPTSSSRSSAGSYSSPSRSSSPVTRSSATTATRSGSSSPVSRTTTGGVRTTAPSSRTAGPAGRGTNVAGSRSGVGGGAPAVRATADGRPNGRPGSGTAYARPGVAGGVMPPSAHPMHPAPYFHHPHHHHMIHMHSCYWDPCCIHHWHWPGWWYYCDSYWYDYQMTNYIIVRDYARSNYGVDLLAYAMSGDFMYCLVNDSDGKTYVQVFDRNDKLLAEQHVNRKYVTMEIDKENGGCWVMKKNGKDPLLFFYTDGQLLIYEAD